jgi:hypothetical protein
MRTRCFNLNSAARRFPKRTETLVYRSLSYSSPDSLKHK